MFSGLPSSNSSDKAFVQDCHDIKVEVPAYIQVQWDPTYEVN